MMFQESTITFLLLCLVVTNAKYFKFEDCSRKDGIAEVSQLKISPDPVDLDGGNMTIDAVIKILRDVPEEAVLKTRYFKLKEFFGVTVDVPIPCLLGKFGSCTLRLCDYLDYFKDQAEVMFPEGQEYGCPVTAGDYGRENTQVKIPDMGPIAKIIVGGRYRTELKLLDRRGGKEIACYKIWTDLR